jgi:hypothetical protein
MKTKIKVLLLAIFVVGKLLFIQTNAQTDVDNDYYDSKPCSKEDFLSILNPERLNSCQALKKDMEKRFYECYRKAQIPANRDYITSLDSHMERVIGGIYTISSDVANPLYLYRKKISDQERIDCEEKHVSLELGKLIEQAKEMS